MEDECTLTVKFAERPQPAAHNAAQELQVGCGISPAGVGWQVVDSLLTWARLQLSEYRGFLKKVPLFAALNEREIEEIAEHLEEQSFAEGDAIISEGEPGESMYVHRCTYAHALWMAG